MIEKIIGFARAQIGALREYRSSAKGLFRRNSSVRLAHTNYHFLPFEKGVGRAAVWHNWCQPFRFEMAAGRIFAKGFSWGDKWSTIGDNHFYKSNHFGTEQLPLLPFPPNKP